ncbi:hypothetical protein GCM10010335_41020 [Streptomyces galbus]|nr:hypothetical protein GCM10010335_41020 [Streptomyces galbus]
MQHRPVQVGAVATAGADGRTHAANFLSHDVRAGCPARLSGTTAAGSAAFPASRSRDAPHPGHRPAGGVTYPTRGTPVAWPVERPVEQAAKRPVREVSGK